MSDVSLQIYAAAVCVFIGICGGFLYEAVALVRFFISGRIVRAAADVLFFAASALMFIGIASAFFLPDLRFYMYAAAGLGFLLYRKSLHRILAFFALRLYNKCRSGLKKRKRGPSVGDEG